MTDNEQLDAYKEHSSKTQPCQSLRSHTGLQTILIVEKTSNNPLQFEDTRSCKTTTIYGKKTYHCSKDIFCVTQNESFPKDIKDIQTTQPVKAHSKLVNFNPYFHQERSLRSLSRLYKAQINSRLKNSEIPDSEHNL